MYVGETEKHIQRVFKTANMRKAVLFFDEADAFLSKRLEVHWYVDKHYNREVNVLLQKLENFEGVSIFATNISVNLDRAFERRFQLKILFEEPDAETREKNEETG